MNKLNELMIFAKVVEAGSFSAAAQLLGVTKSSVSKKISSLEQQLGVKLLQRTTRKIGITEAGQGIYQRCLAIQHELDAVEQEVAAVQQAPTGVLKIGASPMFGNATLAAMIPDFLLRYPDVTVNLHLTELQSDLIGEGFDMSLRMGEMADSTMIAQHLCTVKVLICASPNYLSRFGRPLVPSDLETHQYLRWQQEDTAPFEQVVLCKNGIDYPTKINSKISSNNAIALREAAISGGGITMLPDFAVEQQLAKGELEVVLPDYHINSYPISMVYPDRRQMPAKLSVFIEYLKTKFNR